MPQRVIDTRSADATYATKGNIVPQLLGEGGGRATGGTGVLGTSDVDGTYSFAINDAATGASGVLTDDTTAQTADTAPLPAGTYEVWVKVRHPSTAAANRSVIVQHRNAANNATQRTLETFLADGPTGAVRYGKYTGVVLAAGERIRLVTGTDATNANIYAELSVTKVD